MATIEQQRAMALASARMRAQQQPQRSAFQSYVVDPYASIGAGIEERLAGVQQAFSSPERQKELGKRVEAARKFQEQRGTAGKIGGIIGRDVLAPVVATLPFANPLGAGALLTATGVGAAQGYTAPTLDAQTAGERNLNAITSGALGAVGQITGGVISRLLERGGSGLMRAGGRALGMADNAPSSAQAAERVGEALRSQYGAARTATRGAYEAVEQAGEVVNPQDIAEVFVPQLRQAYQEVAPIIPKAGPLAILQAAEKAAKAGQPVPVSALETLRKEAVLGAMASDPAAALPFQTMRRAYDVAEQMLPNPSTLQQAARAARATQGQLFETPQEVARIVGAGIPEAQFVPPTGEQILQTVIGAGSKGKAGAGKVVDEVLAAAGDAAPAVRADLRQAVIARAYTTSGEDAAKLAKELNKIVSQNESLAKRLFNADELKLISQGAEGSAVQRFVDTIARPAQYTGGGLAGLGLLGASLAPAVSGPAAILGGATMIGTQAARQSASDAAAINMGGLLRELGVRTQAPGVLSRLMAPSAAGLLSVPGQTAFTRPQANQRSR